MNTNSNRKRALFLYYELAGYFIASAQRLASQYPVDVHIVRYPINSVAPFKFENYEGITFYERKDFDRNKLMALAKELNPEFIFCCGWMDKDYVAVCKIFKGITTTIISLDNPWKGNMKQHVGALAGRFYIPKIFNYAWVPGEIQKKYCLKLGFKKQHIFTGLYVADISMFNKQYEYDRSAKQLNFPHKILFVGRYTAHKGVQEMWNAFVRLHKDVPNDWELWCIGKGELEHLLPVHEKVKNFGFVQPSELGQFISQTGVFILASRLEHWGVVVQEFAAAGMPVISTTKTYAASMFVKNNSSGIVCEPSSEEALYQSFIKLVSLDHKTLLQMAEQSHVLAQQINADTWAQTAWKFINSHK
ncbi:MAG: glycosyltransferase family 4 protein [Bacteroidetes bacterium]|nr:glycosyltransferase family 4 protein [Bacteroidota bacterium]